MIPYPHQIVRRQQAELRHEAEMSRLSRVDDQQKSSLIKWKWPIAIASAICIILLRELIG